MAEADGGQSGAEHTPGEWQIYEYEFDKFCNDFEIILENGDHIAVLNGDQNPRAKQDATRILACVTACAGLTNEELARGVVAAAEAAGEEA